MPTTRAIGFLRDGPPALPVYTLCGDASPAVSGIEHCGQFR